MDFVNWLFLTVIAVLMVGVGFLAYRDDRIAATNAAYQEVCIKSDGVPLIVGQSRLCFSKAAVIAIIPVLGQ